MAASILKIWCNASFPDDLTARLNESVAPHRIIWSTNSQKSNLASVGADADARSAQIIYGQPNPDDLIHSTALRWVQVTTAGYTRYDNDSVRNALRARGAIMTNSSAVFSDPCAEHLLAFMLCGARNLPRLIMNDETVHGWPYVQSRNASHLLRGQSALLVGFGAIGRRLVELLTPFHISLRAVRRSARGDEPIPVVTSAHLDEALAGADHVINILPASGDTKHLFNAARFSRMKPGAFFYNIGRGDTVDQDALCDALERGQLGAAYLDVTTPEPLPADHRLWQVPNCWITPHIAGGHRDELRVNVEHFLGNFERFMRDEQLKDRIV